MKLTDIWKKTTLGAIASKDYGLVDGPFGSNLPASCYTESGVPVIRGSNLSLGNERFKSSIFVYVSDKTAERLSRSLAYPGDIIFTKKGTLGQTGIIPKGKFPRYLLSSNQMKLSVSPEAADSLYVYYYVSTPECIDQIIRESTASGVPKTNIAYLRDFPILLPPLKEQRAVARILGALDDKIELNRRMNRTLESVAQAIFRSWFVDFEPVSAKRDGRKPIGMDDTTAALFPEHFQNTDIGPIPSGWQIAPIGELVKVVGGSTPRTNEPSFWEDGDVAWATPKDLSNLTDPVLMKTERQITTAGLSQISSGLLPAGTVLLSSRAPVGYIAIADMPVAVNQGFIALVCNKNLPNHYVVRWLQENMDIIESRANGTTFMEISKANFRPIPAVVPPKPVLDKFSATTSKLHSRLVSNVRQIKHLADLRDTLLPQLLSGELTVGQAEEMIP